MLCDVSMSAKPPLEVRDCDIIQCCMTSSVSYATPLEVRVMRRGVTSFDVVGRHLPTVMARTAFIGVMSFDV